MKFKSKITKDTQDVLINKAREWPDLHVDDDFDEAGLTPIAARLYIHLWRISKKVIVEWPGITAIAHTIRTRRETVIHAIRELEERGFLQVKRSWGLKTEYHPNPKKLWIPVTQTHQSPKRTGVPKAPVTQADRTSHPSVLVQNPPCPSSSSLSGSPSPLESPSFPPLAPPSSNPPVAKKTHGEVLTLESDPPKKDKRRTSVFDELQRHVVKNLGLTEEDACWLWDKWEGNGWKVDGKTMACWRSTASAWERSGYYPTQKAGR